MHFMFVVCTHTKHTKKSKREKKYKRGGKKKILFSFPPTSVCWSLIKTCYRGNTDLIHRLGTVMH